MTKCAECKNRGYTYNGLCNKCAWELMHHYKSRATALHQENEHLQRQLAAVQK